MGSNLTQQASTRAARAVSSLARMANRFDDQTNIHPKSTAHTCKSDEKDLNRVVKELLDNKCLEVIQNRHHNDFQKLDPLHEFSKPEFDLWVKKKMRLYDKYNGHDITFTDITNINEFDDDELHT